MRQALPSQWRNHKALLGQMCRELLGEKSLILACNRAPIEYHTDPEGNVLWRRGSGGVVTALSAIGEHADLTWIASAMGGAERRVAGEAQGGCFRAPLPGHSLYLRFVVFPPNTYHKFYSVFCNPLLWFLQHYMWNSPYTPNIDARVWDAWLNGYVAVNKGFADAVVIEAQQSGRCPFVMLHDYHLYLVAGYIREQIPDAALQHFIHIPWPEPQYWRLLPSAMREAILKGICANDIVGLQTTRDVKDFLYTCDAFLEEAEVDFGSCTVSSGGHLAQVNAYPVSVDVARLRRTVDSPLVQEYEDKLRSLCGQKTIVRVDRMEPSKNIVRGFKAFDLLLERHPELLAKVNFLAFLVPSRTHIKQYQRYAHEVNEIIGAINTKYSNEDWQPIRVFYENNYHRALAGMRLYDVLLVNPVIDGMNLVAKEGPSINARDGVLVLSECAGAYEQLGKNALSVVPTDLVGTMDALYRALTMSAGERQRRADSLRRSIEEEDIAMWLYRQLADVNALVQQRSPSPI